MKHQCGTATGRGHPEHHTNTGTNKPAEQPEASHAKSAIVGKTSIECDLN